MTIIELHKRYYAIPTEWNELSRAQLLAVMDAVYHRQYTKEQCQIKLVKILSGISWWKFFRTKPSEIAEYFYLTEFLISSKINLTKNLIPEYRGFYGPESEFDNLKMKEMAICDAKFMQWANDRDNETLLDEICSVLYRRAKSSIKIKYWPDGDVRKDFNQTISDRNAKRYIRKWPVKVKMAIAYWYDSCRHELVAQFSEVFGGSSGDDVIKYGLVSCMLSVAEGHALGDFSQVENHYVKTVLMHLDDSIRKAKAQEKSMK